MLIIIGWGSWLQIFAWSSIAHQFASGHSVFWRFSVSDFQVSNPAFSRGRQLVSFRFKITSLCQGTIKIKQQICTCMYLYIYCRPIHCKDFLWQEILVLLAGKLDCIGCSVRMMSSTLMLYIETKLVDLMIRRRAWSSFDIIVFNRCPCSPWVRLLNIALGFLGGTVWHSSFYLHLHLRKIWEPNIFSIITGRILVGMIATLVWDSNFHTLTAHSWMWSTQMCHTALGEIRHISATKKEGWPGLDKSDGRPKKKLSKGRERSFKYCQWPYININTHFHQLLDKMVAFGGWFHTGSQCKCHAL